MATKKEKKTERHLRVYRPHTRKTKDWAKQTPSKTCCDLKCSGRVLIRRAAHISSNPVISLIM